LCRSRTGRVQVASAAILPARREPQMDKYQLMALVLAIPFWQFGLFFLFFPRQAQKMTRRLFGKLLKSKDAKPSTTKTRMVGVMLFLAGCLVAAIFNFVMSS